MNTLKSSVNTTLLAVTAVIVLTLTIVLFISIRQSKKVKETSASVSQTEEVLLHLQKLVFAVLDNETGARGYVITGKTVFLGPLQKSETDIITEQNLLNKMVTDEETVSLLRDSLSIYVAKRMDFSRKMISIYDSKGKDAAAAMVAAGEGKTYTDNIRFIVNKITDKIDDRLAIVKKGNGKTINQLNTFLYGVLIVSLLLSLVLAQKIASDIKTQKGSGQKFSALLDAAPDATIIVNDKGIIQMVNRQTESLFHYSRSDLIGQPVEVLIPANLRGSHVKHRDDFFKSARVRAMGAGIELNALTREGAYFPVEISLSPIQMPEGLLVSASVRDISERKKAENKIRENEQAFSSLFYKSPIMKIISDASTGEFLDVNDAFVDFIEIPKQEILGKKSTDLNFIVQSGMRDLILNRLRQDGMARDVEGQIGSRSGKIRWVSCHIDQISYYGKACYLTAIVDISQRKLVEQKLLEFNESLEQKVNERSEALMKSEQQLRHTLDNMLEGAQIVGFDWKYKYVNDSFAKHARYSKEELLDYTVMEKFPGIEQTEIYKIYLKCFDERIPVHLENEFLFPDGSTGWFELSFQPVPEGIFILSVDITDRKKAEQKIIQSEKIYKTIASSIPGSVICLLDTDYRYMLIEGDMLEKIGYSRDQLLGNKIEDVLPPDMFDRVRQEFDRVMKGEIIIRQTSMQGYNIISRLIPLKDENNSVYAILTVAIDITELEKAKRDIIELNRDLEEKIIIRTEQLRKSNEELEAFSYSVSHDLRAPLRAIMGFAAILEEDYSSRLDEEAKRITGIIKKNTLKMGRLIDDLLSFSRLGRQDITKASLDTEVLVRDVIHSLTAASGNIEWVIQSLPPVNADINTMRQVWTNLLSNAIKYSGGNPRPKIEIGSFAKNGQVLFFVKDNGVGFDEKYKHKLFNVFQRLHSADEFEGTGVGLAIVERVVSRHGGKVWAEAAINGGATFWFSVPA